MKWWPSLRRAQELPAHEPATYPSWRTDEWATARTAHANAIALATIALDYDGEMMTEYVTNMDGYEAALTSAALANLLAMHLRIFTDNDEHARVLLQELALHQGDDD